MSTPPFVDEWHLRAAGSTVVLTCALCHHQAFISPCFTTGRTPGIVGALTHDCKENLLATRPHDGRRVVLCESRGGWRYTGLSGICECVSDDGKAVVLTVEHDPEEGWPVGSKVLVTFDHETQPTWQPSAEATP